MIEQTLTAEQIEKHFASAMDSVALIKSLSAKTSLTEDEKGMIARNKEHLQTVIAKDWFSAAQKATLQKVL